ncbi:hypothetical protein ACFOEE_12735 [Pseudoalteromonas fenneropenaei]|uniref:Uncharacterized protein n=1 Tax=Pseudoalteromonas fenneropenaei TaxID=1737459 RepID=A0ABV7CLQ9_9GAMM
MACNKHISGLSYLTLNERLWISVSLLTAGASAGAPDIYWLTSGVGLGELGSGWNIGLSFL